MRHLRRQDLPTLNSIRVEESIGRSNYNGWNIAYRQRMSSSRFAECELHTVVGEWMGKRWDFVPQLSSAGI